ncbi:MAG TPA: helix-turn-helix domain-containing protein [Mycobacteriales bacterium]|nr:helix-turn-helix domain-containing protein [Mycobacteriales bacterium]
MTVTPGLRISIRNRLRPIKQLEKLLKIPRQTQMDLRARGSFIPHFFVGHKALYRKEAVLRWIQEQESKAAGGADACP